MGEQLRGKYNSERGAKMKETEVRLEEMKVVDPQLTLVQSLDLKNRLASALKDIGRGDFADSLGMARARWWRWRTKGVAPVKVNDYLHIIARFPELRGKVWRHLLHRALTEVDRE